MPASAIKKLTQRQQAILSQIRRFFDKEGFYPTIRDLNHLLKVKSSNTVFSHIRALDRKGYLKKNAKGKIIAVLPAAENRESADFTGIAEPNLIGIPYFSSGMPARPPSSMEDLPGKFLHLDQYLVNKLAQTFALKVSGDSMEKAGIISGDILLVEKRNDAHPGQLIVTHQPSGFAVKRLVEEGTSIWGVVTATLRKY